MMRISKTSSAHRATWLAVIVLTCVAFESALASSLSPTVVIGSLDVPPSAGPQTASLDLLFATPSGFSLDVAGFQLGLSIDGPDDAVKFVSAGPPLGKPYFFAAQSTTPYFTISPDGSRMRIGDFLNADFGQASSENGLASIRVSIFPSVAGKSYSVVVDPDPMESYLGNSSTNLLPIIASKGVITVAPEPACSALIPMAFAAAFSARARLRRRSRRLASSMS